MEACIECDDNISLARVPCILSPGREGWEREEENGENDGL